MIQDLQEAMFEETGVDLSFEEARNILYRTFESDDVEIDEELYD